MSSTSSILGGYDNNNDINKSKKRAAIVPTGKSSSARHPRGGCCSRAHLNNLWSFWYGVLGTGLQAYTTVKCLKRILGFPIHSWPESFEVPYLELNVSLGLTAAAVLLLPLFTASAIFKIGNLANDGYKLGRQLGVCSRETPYVLHDAAAFGSCSVWRHGGPTAPFVHLVIAFCLLVPKLLMEARLIEGMFLPQESIWRTDLDFMVVHRDRLVVLSFMTSANSTGGQQPTLSSALPMIGVPTSNSTTPDPSPGALPLTSSQVTHTVLKTLKTLMGHDNNSHTHSENFDSLWGSTLSVEYLNLALALLVYSVRYPALFWTTNKCMGMIFSFQLLINGLHTLLAYAGMSILYKVQIVGVAKALPLLKHHQHGAMMISGGLSPFLLNPQVSLALYLLSTLLVLASSLVLYLYGHTRLIAFLNQERERKVITLKEGNSNRWSYFTHCAALCVLVAVGVCNAPLLHDYTVVYRGSLDDTVLACIIGGILHLFLWVVIWLFLTIKQNWVFKLRVTVATATVRHARSIKLVTDVDYKTHHAEDASHQPLLVVGNGRTYSISDNSSKKTIMGVVQKASMSKKSENGYATSDDGGEEQIYWLRPALVTPQNSPDGSKSLCWFSKKPKHKVTFNESSSTSVNRGKNNGARAGRVPGNDEDDGDYATLRELPLPPSSTTTDTGDDTASEEGKPTNSGQTPRCLRRADSGMPHDELTPRSDSVSTGSSTSPPEAPGSNHSETSSGVHSNDSSEHHPPTVALQQQNHTRRATSVADLAQSLVKEEVHWKSCSLQRNVAPPTSSPHFTPAANNVFRYSGSPTYVPCVAPKSTEASDHAVPAVILENPSESTVVIRRKISRPNTAEIVAVSPPIKEEPFGRATNMRMVSFMENTDLKNIQASSATLPHYPTQPVPVQSAYPHCSTMPLPQHSSIPTPASLGGGNSCNVYPRQHTTIPIHHNGVKLFNSTQNPYIKRLQCQMESPIKTKISEPIYTGINRISGENYHYST